MLIEEIQEIQGIVQQDLEALGLFFCDYCECPNQEFDHHILHRQGKCGDCTTDLEFDIIEPTAEAIRLLQNPDNPW
jgi:hypothetical protein